MTKEQLAKAIHDALKSTNTMDYVSAEEGDLSGVVIDGRFDLLEAAETILRATSEPRGDYRAVLEKIRDYCDNAIAQGAADKHNALDIFNMADDALEGRKRD